MIKKNLTKYFVNSKSCITFAPAFREGASSVRIDQKIFQKLFCQIKKMLYFCTRFQKGS